MPNHCVFAQEQKGGYFEEDMWKTKASAKPNGKQEQALFKRSVAGFGRVLII